MRSLQTKLEWLCKFTSNECFVKAGMFDAVPGDKTGLEIANVANDRQLFGKFHSEKSYSHSPLKAVLKNSGFHKNKIVYQQASDVIREINALSRSEEIEITSGILYSSLTNERYFVIVLKNKKFKSAEVLTFGAGESAATF